MLCLDGIYPTTSVPTDPGWARGTCSPLSHLRERNDAGGDVSRRRGVILKHHGWRYRVDVLKSGGGVDRIECGCVLTILLPFCEMDGVGIEQTCRCRVSLLD